MTSRATRLGFLTLLFALFSAGGTSAQESTGPADEGIQVHGHWTVTVVRDGQVVESRQFENDLTGAGQGHLSQVLSREYTPGPWVILVEADGTGTLCAENEFVLGPDTDCTISQSADEATATATAPPQNSLLIEGTETVVRDANITIVGTFQWWCIAETATDACVPAAVNRAQFTRKSLDTPIAVLSGDRIEVTVEISFS
jgi:hypothetical protein